MADDLKVKAGKALDNARVAAHAVIDDVSVAAHNTLVGTEADVQKVSNEVKHTRQKQNSGRSEQKNAVYAGVTARIPEFRSMTGSGLFKKLLWRNAYEPIRFAPER